jgi:hypothetical protein
MGIIFPDQSRRRSTQRIQEITSDIGEPDMPERDPVMTGGCQCGAVRYALFAKPEASLCHCRMCQKAVGGPFAALAKVAKADIAWTRGQPAAYRSSSAAFRDFCAACGTPLTFRFPDAAHMEVTLGSLDRPQDAAPVRHFGVEGRMPWLTEAVTGGLPETTTDQNAKPERPVRSYQHPDHDTPDGWAPHI